MIYEFIEEFRRKRKFLRLRIKILFLPFLSHIASHIMKNRFAAIQLIETKEKDREEEEQINLL